MAANTKSCDEWVQKLIAESSKKNPAFAGALQSPIATKGMEKAWRYANVRKNVLAIETAKIWMVVIGNQNPALWVYFNKHDGGDERRFNTGVAFGRILSLQTAKETESSATTCVAESHAATPSSSKVATFNSMTTSPSQADTRIPNVVDGKIEDSDWLVISNGDGEDGEWELLEDAMDGDDVTRSFLAD